MDIKSLIEHNLLTKTASNEYTLQAGDDFTKAATMLENLGWKPTTHVVGEGIRTVSYTPVGIPDAYERLRSGATITYKVLHSGKIVQARPSAKKTFGWPVQFELYDVTDVDSAYGYYLRRFYLNREDVASVFYVNNIVEVQPQEREDLEDEPVQPVGEDATD